MSRPASEQLRIVRGRLGALRPVAKNEPLSIDIRPLTVFVGKQGTGKSLLAQVLYLFRGLPNLAQFDAASRRDDEAGARDPKKAFRRIADGLRSRHRSFANLTEPNVVVEWDGEIAVGSTHPQRFELGFNAQHVTRQVLGREPVLEIVKRSWAARRQPWTAVFLPTERLLYSLALGPTSLPLIGAPLILEIFAHWMELAGIVQSEWRGVLPDTDEGRWVREYLVDALAGEARRTAMGWRWNFRDGGKPRAIDLDMASSGQRANWPLLLVPQVLFSMRARGELAPNFTLYVEEPEIHLHPEAERAVTMVLAYLVNNGFRVVVTTHSLTVLYMLNNLILAEAKNAPASETPREARIAPDHVAAYHVMPGGRVQRLQNDDDGLIDEGALGSVADQMAAQMNRLYALRTP